MGLLSKFKSSPGGAKDTRAGASTDANEYVRDARARARRRLIGAALLLGLGIIGFPLLFETQPRPIAVDIPIEIPSREAVAPLQSPAPRPIRSAPTEPVKPVADASLTAGATGASAQEPSPSVAEPAAPKPEPKSAAVPVTKPPAQAKPPEAQRVAEAKPARALEAAPAEAKPAPKPPNAGDAGATDDGRFVVQIGAFAEASGAREARLKVEGMGLKTYTQVIESSSGRRIRVRIGPYATKAEADKAASRVKSGGLQAAVLKL
jgi:DedD protein